MRIAGRGGGSRRMGRAFLPVALLLIAIRIFLGSYMVLGQQVPPALHDSATLAVMGRNWVNIQFLVLFVAWQYNLSWSMVSGIGLSLLDAALFFPFVVPGSILYSVYSMLVVARLVSVTGTGLAFAWLMKRQREHRADLAQANRKLALHAATTEQLAVSQERNRLARELHDTLAHSLSAVIALRHGLVD